MGLMVVGVAATLPSRCLDPESLVNIVAVVCVRSGNPARALGCIVSLSWYCVVGGWLCWVLVAVSRG